MSQQLKPEPRRQMSFRGVENNMTGIKGNRILPRQIRQVSPYSAEKGIPQDTIT
jgi:hypothetical protein